MTDRISLTGLRARGCHGVLPAERELGQEFVADLVLHLDTREAAAGDDLAATVNYAEVAREVVEVLAGPPVDLIETVAAMIAERVLRFARVQAVDVVIHKPAAPIPHPFTDVTVHVHRTNPPAAPDLPLGVDLGSAGDPEMTPKPEERAGGRAAAPSEVVVALGANLGDARANLREAVDQLGRHPRVRVSAVSPLVRSVAHVRPGAPPQPDYLNAVVVLETTLPVRELFALCQGIELGHGRVRGETWGARPLDLDLIAAGPLTRREPDLTLPHPRAHERGFVLAPWARVAPDAELPGLGRVDQLAQQLGEDGLEWVADQWWKDVD